MKKFEEPVIEVVEFGQVDVIVTSDGPCDYVCPTKYGNECEVNHSYNGQG